MKLLMVNKAYPPHIGGIETLVREYAEGFSKQAEVTVLVCRDGFGRTVQEQHGAVRVVRAGSFGTYFSCPVSLSFFFWFRKLSKEADAIELHMPFPLGDLACLLSGYRGKVVAAWHSDVVKQKRLMRFYQPILTRFLKRADRILVATKGHIESSPVLPQFLEKCRILPYGIRPEAYWNAPLRPILTERMRTAGVKLLFAGRLVYYKGVNVLLEAMTQVRGCTLFLAGDGVLRQELEQQAQDLGLQEQVQFLGSLSDADLKSAFADCDLLILPSVQNSEAFGIVQLEAMVYGKPVINTALPTGVPHVSLHEKTGLTVAPGDSGALARAIQRLADDPTLRKQFGDAGRQRVAEQFSMDTLLERAYGYMTN